MGKQREGKGKGGKGKGGGGGGMAMPNILKKEKARQQNIQKKEFVSPSFRFLFLLSSDAFFFQAAEETDDFHSTESELCGTW